MWDAVGGLQTDTPKVDDLDFWLRVLSAGHDVRMIPDRLAVFRMESRLREQAGGSGGQDDFDTQRERALRRAAESTGNPADLAAFRRVQRLIRYVQALRRGRNALADGNLAEARREFGCALGLRRTPRTVAIAAALRVAPRLAVRALAAKRAAQASLRGAREGEGAAR